MLTRSVPTSDLECSPRVMASSRLSASLYVYSSDRDRNSDMLCSTDTRQTHAGTRSQVQRTDPRTSRYTVLKASQGWHQTHTGTWLCSNIHTIRTYSLYLAKRKDPDGVKPQSVDRCTLFILNGRHLSYVAKEAGLRTTLVHFPHSLH